MNAFTLSFKSGGIPTHPPQGAAFQVETYGWSIAGGPTTAEITMTGPEMALWNSSNMLMWDVAIHNRRLEPRWWGAIVGVSITVGTTVWSVSLDSVANRIKVVYTAVTTDGDTTTQSQATTDWAEHLDSINVFGARELRFTMNEATAASAEAQRDELLAYGHYPLGSADVAGRAASKATLHCRGWWDSLSWRYAAAVDAMGSQDVGEKIEDLITTYGQQLAGVEHRAYSDLQTTRALSGESRAKAEVESLLRMGTASAARLMARVEERGIVVVEAEPISDDASDYHMSRTGALLDAYGVPVALDACPVGVWRRLSDTIPAGAINPRVSTLGREFIEAAEYNARSNTLSTRARGVKSVWDIGTI